MPRGTVYSSVTGLRWAEEVGDASVRVVTGECRIGGLRLGDAMVPELDPDGKIVRIRPHLWPWLATSVLAITLGVRLIARPGVLRRALIKTLSRVAAPLALSSAGPSSEDAGRSAR